MVLWLLEIDHWTSSSVGAAGWPYQKQQDGTIVKEIEKYGTIIQDVWLWRKRGKEGKRKNCRAVRRFFLLFYSTPSFEYGKGLMQGCGEDMTGRTRQTESPMWDGRGGIPCTGDGLPGERARQLIWHGSRIITITGEIKGRGGTAVRKLIKCFLLHLKQTAKRSVSWWRSRDQDERRKVKQ